MYQLKQQKKVIAAMLVAVITLSIITVANNPEFIYKSPTVDMAKDQRDYQQRLADIRAEYQRLLALEETDPEASKVIMEQLITEADVQLMAEEFLDTKQKAEVPKIPDSAVNVANTESAEAVSEYFEKYFAEKKKLTDAALSTSRNLYRPVMTEGEIDSAIAKSKGFVDVLYQLPAPTPVLSYHKASIVVSESYQRLLALAKEYNGNPISEPWPEIYKEWKIIDSLALSMQDQLNGLDKKYSVTRVFAEAYGVTEENGEKTLLATLGLVKEAEAFGLFGITFNFELGSILEEIKDAIASALAAFFSRLLSSIIDKIEQNFQISNFLLYADALVAGQYAPDYFDKYVPDKLDQDLIKRFLPQFNCGVFDTSKANLLANQKAQEYIGVDLTKPLDTTAEDFYAIAGRANHFLAGTDTQLIGAYAQAQTGLTKISEAINNELNASGKKTGRGSGSSTGSSDKLISLSVGAVQDVQLANFVGTVMSGSNPARVNIFISNIVKQVVTSFLNNFIFRRAKFVYKEQSRQACVAGVTQLGQITPAQIPDAGPDVIDQGFIDRCKANPQQCATDINNGTLNPPPPDPDQSTSKLQMDKYTYLVGEVPKFQLSNTGAPEGTRIGWKTDLIRDPNGNNVDPVIGQFIYEDQFIDADGNWPGTGFAPYDRPFVCGDVGTWVKTAILDDKQFSFEYKVVPNTNSPDPNKSCQQATP